jgi:hypothetical protein
MGGVGGSGGEIMSALKEGARFLPKQNAAGEAYSGSQNRASFFWRKEANLEENLAESANIFFSPGK